jgi:signal transduction histidine kinase
MDFNTKITDELLIEELKIRIFRYREALDELQKLNSELKEVNRKLQDSESLKSHFLSNIANEIVNPFTSILGLSKTIMQVDKENYTKAQKMAEYIYLEAFNLDFQLKNIFAAAEIEAGEAYPFISNVHIVDILADLNYQFKFDVQNKNIDFEFVNKIEKEKIFFKTDCEKFSLIISNFISNAIKYSKEETKITITAENFDNKLKVTVSDSGIGISTEKQQQIFDRFNRLNKGINSIDRGHGIGLSICKSYAELLDGEIVFKSSENEGSEFMLILPESKSDSNNFSSDSNKILFGNDEVF